MLGALREIGEQIEARKPSLDGILGLKGVLEQHDAPLDADSEEKLQAAIYAALALVVSAGLNSPDDFRPWHLRQRINVAER